LAEEAFRDHQKRRAWKGEIISRLTVVQNVVDAWYRGEDDAFTASLERSSVKAIRTAVGWGIKERQKKGR
jgi:hypothetical protein